MSRARGLHEDVGLSPYASMARSGGAADDPAKSKRRRLQKRDSAPASLRRRGHDDMSTGRARRHFAVFLMRRLDAIVWAEINSSGGMAALGAPAGMANDPLCRK